MDKEVVERKAEELADSAAGFLISFSIVAIRVTLMVNLILGIFDNDPFRALSNGIIFAILVTTRVAGGVEYEKDSEISN